MRKYIGGEMSSQRQSIDFSSMDTLLEVIQGFWVARATCVAAEFGIPDLLKSGPKKNEQLAEVMGLHAPSLYRLMRALSSVGVFSQDEQQRFALTPLGAALCSDGPRSLRSFAIELLGRNHYVSWEKLGYSVKTGGTAFNHVYGASKWQYHAKHPGEARIYDAAMAGFNTVTSDVIVASYDFSSVGTIVDLGGGDGSVLVGVLKAHPHLQGVLADLPHVIDGAWQRIKREGLDDRCVVVPADFFKLIPKGDVYLLKWIIHDWDDESAQIILQNCCAAMAHTDRLLLIESVIGPENNTCFTKFMDLAMLVMTGGRERTETEYRALLGRAGLKLTRIIPTKTEMSLIEAKRA
jgi:hypothetical protein